MRHKRIGPYQRPAPPKRPLGLRAPKTIQQLPVSVHEVKAKASELEEALVKERENRRGRPTINERPMTPAERQAKRRALQARELAIQAVLQVGDAHGKCHAEARSGGYDSDKMDTIYGLRQMEFDETEDGVETHRRRHVHAAEGESSAADELTTDEIFSSGESSFHRGGLDLGDVQKIRVRGLRIGDEESNRRRFAEEELKKMVAEYFTSPTDRAPSAFWLAKHNGNITIQNHERATIKHTCELCGDSMNSAEDAVDHLRVDHRDAINAWFSRIEPPREFRDMRSYVTIVKPKKCKEHLDSSDCKRTRAA